MLFSAAAYNLDDPSKQKLYLDVNADDTYTALANTQISYSELNERMRDKDAILIVGKGKYVGHPELPPVELCFYWLKDQYTRAIKCEVHNTN